MNEEGASAHPEIVRVKGTIHNPKAPLHYMKIKPVDHLIKISRGKVTLAQTRRALRLLEVGFDMYDPVLYVPRDDVLIELKPIADKTTFCPLKGHASYFTLGHSDADNGGYMAWTYSEPLDIAEILKGHIAFDASKIRVEEIGPESQ